MTELVGVCVCLFDWSSVKAENDATGEDEAWMSMRGRRVPRGEQ
jgi:hypothetical protein